MQKLRYDKIAEEIIAVNLQNGYTVIAMRNYSHHKDRYNVKLYIKDNTVDNLDLMEKFEKVKVKTNGTDGLTSHDDRIVNAEITKLISELYRSGKFDYYINRYKYQMKCFDYGNEHFEKKGS